MLNPQLKKFIEDSLEGGADERIIERKLVSKGWVRNEVMKAISETKQAIILEKKGTKKNGLDQRVVITAIAVFVVFLVFAIMFLQLVKKQPGTWCKKDALWTDPLVDKNQQFIVKQNFTFMNKIVCYAVSKDNPNLGYRFTKDNKEIWEVEIKPAPKNSSRKLPVITQIKPQKYNLPLVPPGNVNWCKQNSSWTDPIIPKTEELIVRNPLVLGDKTMCFASLKNDFLNGYRFTQNNAEIWKVETKRIDGTNKATITQIKPKQNQPTS